MTYELPLIWKDPAWPHLRFDMDRVTQALLVAKRMQGMVEGKWASISPRHRAILAASAWSDEAIATAAIEGERYDRMSVESSVARRLGIDEGIGPHVPRDIEGLLDVMDDALIRCAVPLTHERLWSWQGALFPESRSGLRKIEVGAYRSHPGPMQIVSGPVGREKVHYEAPPSSRVLLEMERFVKWFNGTPGKDPLVIAAIAHVWFESIHPFEDGNGRIGRTLIDLVLAREMGPSSRVIRMSKQLLKEREAYYEGLRESQVVDVTRWVEWFLDQVCACCREACQAIDVVLETTRFWMEHQGADLSTRQRKVMRLLLDAGPNGFEGGMSTRKYESIGATSRATASRELQQLEELGFLRRVGAGRSTRYHVAIDGWGPADDKSAKDPSDTAG
ncbi:Fic family protein [Mitsuaria sp. GD03876]|uniref:Fic family protein n=1 Tax=Mitsuaria sp. GD03876 TaxID=2975399 RepID=UPI00244AF6AE|nr:Fic family protein [Mitsuaria sp. GD03876]MDH0865658.1 Fic family protein [Mitsuaria sp. GD03876]